MKKILIIIFLIQCFCCFANKTKLYHGNMIFQCVKISDDSIEFIDFDLKNSGGRGIVTKLNGRNAEYMEPLKDGDVIEIYWE